MKKSTSEGPSLEKVGTGVKLGRRWTICAKPQLWRAALAEQLQISDSRTPGQRSADEKNGFEAPGRARSQVSWPRTQHPSVTTLLVFVRISRVLVVLGTKPLYRDLSESGNVFSSAASGRHRSDRTPAVNGRQCPICVALHWFDFHIWRICGSESLDCWLALSLAEKHNRAKRAPINGRQHEARL